MPDHLRQDALLDKMLRIHIAVDSKIDGLTETRDKAIIQLLYATGIRLRELVGLSIRDVNFEERTVRVFGKGSKERIVPVGITCFQTISRYLDIRADRYQIPVSEEPLFWGKTAQQNISTYCSKNRGKAAQRYRRRCKRTSSYAQALICHSSS